VGLYILSPNSGGNMSQKTFYTINTALFLLTVFNGWIHLYSHSRFLISMGIGLVVFLPVVILFFNIIFSKKIILRYSLPLGLLQGLGLLWNTMLIGGMY
jgi:hypothetical protein